MPLEKLPSMESLIDQKQQASVLCCTQVIWNLDMHALNNYEELLTIMTTNYKIVK